MTYDMQYWHLITETSCTRETAELIKQRQLVVTVTPLEEFTSIRGNVVDSGDDSFDKAMEDEVYLMLSRTLWGWCCASVEVSNGVVTGTGYLGCVSEDSAESFKQGMYFDSMLNEAISDFDRQCGR